MAYGKGGSPGTPTPDWDKNWPPKPKPQPKPKLANLADGEPDASIMRYWTENGFALDGRGRAYMQTGGKFYDAGEYNLDVHGLPVPLVQKQRKKLQIA